MLPGTPILKLLMGAAEAALEKANKKWPADQKITPMEKNEILNDFAEHISTDPVITNATNSEPWYKSRIVLYALAGVILAAANYWGLDLVGLDQNNLTNTLLNLASIGSVLMAVKERVTKKPKAPVGG